MPNQGQGQAYARLALGEEVDALDTRVRAVEDASHTHANKSVIDKITNADLTKWNGITDLESRVDNTEGASHGHANKSVIDGISAEDVAAWDNKVDKVTGKGLSENDYTTEEKNKLAGVDVGANNYTHPATHSASMIVGDSTHRMVTDEEKSTWNNKVDKVPGKELSENDFSNHYKDVIDLIFGADQLPEVYDLSTLTLDDLPAESSIFILRNDTGHPVSEITGTDGEDRTLLCYFAYANAQAYTDRISIPDGAEKYCYMKRLPGSNVDGTWLGTVVIYSYNALLGQLNKKADTSDLTALANKVTAMETALGTISGNLDAVNGV